MIYYEQITVFGRPLLDGGVLDQPYIFMKEYAICDQTKRMFDAIRKANDEANNDVQNRR